MPQVLEIDEFGFGLSWVLDEPMQRASHALADAGRVWLVDPVDVPEGIEVAQRLGEVAGVLQLLDRHPRDCAALAERFGVPHLRLPDRVGGAPFELFDVLSVPRWREVGLWWPEHGLLVVPEVVGAGPFYRGGDVPTGIHPFLRLRPPGSPKRYAPEHLLMGHGPSLHGPAAADGLRVAYQRALRDLPATLLRIPRAFKG